jgi:hypothetical protein
MSKKLLLAALSMALVGCGSSGETTAVELPKDWRAFHTSGGYVSYVFPVTMADGTRCIVLSSNSSGRGGITCDWGKK